MCVCVYVLSQFTVDMCLPKLKVGRVNNLSEKASRLLLYIHHADKKKSGTNDFGVKTFKGLFQKPSRFLFKVRIIEV